MVKGLEVEQLSANREGESSWPKLVEGEAGSQGTHEAPQPLHAAAHSLLPNCFAQGRKIAPSLANHYSWVSESRGLNLPNQRT